MEAEKLKLSNSEYPNHLFQTQSFPDKCSIYLGSSPSLSPKGCAKFSSSSPRGRGLSPRISSVHSRRCSSHESWKLDTTVLWHDYVLLIQSPSSLGPPVHLPFHDPLGALEVLSGFHTPYWGTEDSVKWPLVHQLNHLPQSLHHSTAQVLLRRWNFSQAM